MKEAVAQVFRRIKVSVVGSIPTSMIPDPFDRIKFRRIGGQQEYLHFIPVFCQPIIYFRFLMVRSIVLDQEYSPTALVKTGKYLLFQKAQIGFRIEIVGLMMVHKLVGIQGYGTEDFLRIPLPSSRDLRLTTTWSPSPVKSGGLPKGGFVLVDNQSFFRLGFFFKFGYR